MKESKKEDEKMTQIHIKLPVTLKESITERAAEETIKRRSRVAENLLCVEILERGLRKSKKVKA